MDGARAASAALPSSVTTKASSRDDDAAAIQVLARQLDLTLVWSTTGESLASEAAHWQHSAAGPDPPRPLSRWEAPRAGKWPQVPTVKRRVGSHPSRCLGSGGESRPASSSGQSSSGFVHLVYSARPHRRNGALRWPRGRMHRNAGHGTDCHRGGNHFAPHAPGRPPRLRGGSESRSAAAALARSDPVSHRQPAPAGCPHAHLIAPMARAYLGLGGGR